MKDVSDALDGTASALAFSKGKKAPQIRTGPQNLLTDFGEVFLNLFDKHEIPARQEAKKYGARVLDGDFDKATHRNRLDVGVPWSEIVRHLRKFYPLTDRASVSNLISLLLDYWNDIGVSVPIFCVRDGVILRAFRHGEDVKVTNQELVMIREMAQGYIEASRHQSIPRLLFEKMVVSLTRVGVARDWLNPTFGPTGEEVARIGYHLKGAVVFLPRRTTSMLAGPEGTWLSAYCVQRGVLKLNRNQYEPGISLEANFERPWAPGEAKKFGRLFGMVADTDGPLGSTRAQIVLATCIGPRDTAGAIEAELDLVLEWCNRVLPSFGSALATNIETAESKLAGLRRSIAHEAVFSARMRDQLKKKEGADFNIDQNIAYLAGEDFINANELADHCALENSRNYMIQTSPDGYNITTKVNGWNVGEVR